MSGSQAAIAGKAAFPLFLPSDLALDRTRQNRLYGRLRAQDVAAPAATQIGGSVRFLWLVPWTHRVMAAGG